MTTETKPRAGRPQIKPMRKMTGFALNVDLPNKLQQLQIKRNGESLNDLFNEAIINLLSKEGIK